MKKIIFVALSLWMGVANATTIDINNSHLGFYEDGQQRNPASAGYYVSYGGDEDETRSFFSFDLSNVNETITSATLELFIGASDLGTLTLYDVSTPANTLVNDQGSNYIFDDLGSGLSYGQMEMTNNLTNRAIQIELNSDALSSINLAGGLFSIGASYFSTWNDSLLEAAYLTGDPNFWAENKLILNTEVPLPPALFLFGSGLMGLFGMKKKKSSQR